MDYNSQSVDANTSDADLIESFVEAKKHYDEYKASYEALRDKMLTRFGDLCECDNVRKVGGELRVISPTVSPGKRSVVVHIESQVSFEVFDFQALPNVVKPLVKVTEKVSLTKAGSQALTNYLTTKYGAIDYDASSEFFDSIGIKVSLTKKIKVKPSLVSNVHYG